mmetsp:Transcript_46632/g.69371  ORF Transcript_46632/g.69371 Transcript_46632/m.69371 type:complete len:125 (-) Transcript_46632:349-723(-)
MNCGRRRRRRRRKANTTPKDDADETTDARVYLPPLYTILVFQFALDVCLLSVGAIGACVEIARLRIEYHSRSGKMRSYSRFNRRQQVLITFAGLLIRGGLLHLVSTLLAETHVNGPRFGCETDG